MLRGRSVQRMGIAGGLLVLSVGAFALGAAMSESMRPLPPIPPGATPSSVALPSSPTKPAPPTTRGVMQAPPSDALPPQAFTAPAETTPALADTPNANRSSPDSEAKHASDRSLSPHENSSPKLPSDQTSSRPDDATAPAQRRAQARQAADGHWQGRDGVKVTPVPADAGKAPPASVRGSDEGASGLGFLADIAGLPQALAAIATGNATAKPEIDGLVRTLLTNRDDANAWSELTSALDRAGQRSAAITVANHAMDAAKRNRDGDSMARLTRQIAQLELNGKDVPPSPTANPAPRHSATQAKTADKGQPKTEPPSVPVAAPDTLDADLDNALRNNAATEALNILQQMAQGSIARGDFAAAQKSYNAALNLAHLSRLGEARADQYANLGRLNWKKGDRAEAEAYLRAARDQYEQFDLTAKAAEMSSLLRQISPAALSSPSKPTQSGKRTSSIIELR